MIYDVCIIGGGASGMTAAITAAQGGSRVLLLDRLDQLGKKILATGNGRCNLSNTQIIKGQIPADAYRSVCRTFPYRVLSHFDVEDTYRFFGGLGLYTHIREQYIYPRSDQASSVAQALLMKIEELGLIDVRVSSEVHEIKVLRQVGQMCYEILDTNQRKYSARNVILACGSRSGAAGDPRGSGYKICRQLGLELVRQVPALCAMHCMETYFKDLAGVRVQGSITLLKGREILAKDQGEIQLTSYGISGIPAFQVSRYAAYALENREKVTAVIDLLPDLTQDRIARILRKQGELFPERNLIAILSGLLNRKLAAFIASQMKKNLYGRDLDKAVCVCIAKNIKEMRAEVTKVAGFKESQVTAGGVDTSQINEENMEVKALPGLYITGELLDVDGICGGFNLQWAWATGYLAGKAAGSRKNND